MKLYEQLLDQAEAHGISALFGIPDPAFFALFNAAQARGWAVLAPHHEAAAGFMAEGWARITGQGAICAASLGPGFANMLPAMMHAQAEGSPVLFLAGRRAGLGAGPEQGRFQHAAQQPVAKAALGYAEELTAPADITNALVALRTGPAYLELAGLVLEEEGAAAISAPQPEPRPDLAPALELIAKAKAPLILAGHGIQSSQTQSALEALAQALSCPILATPALGGIAQAIPYGFSPQTRALIAAADLILAIGTQIGDQLHFGQTRHWKAASQGQKWLHIGRGPAPADKARRPVDVVLTGDLAPILPALAQALPQRSANPARVSIAQTETAHREAQAALARAHPETPLHPARLVVEATQALPENAILIRDGGALVLFQMAFGQSRPRDVLWSQNSGHLGTGLPMAIGAMLAAPKRPAMLLTGDSALLFHIAELESAARAKLPLVIIVGVDHQYGLEVGMSRLSGKTGETGLHWNKSLRFDHIAQGFACDGAYVESAADLPQALARAFATAQANSRPYVLHASIDAKANAQDMPALGEFASWFA